jgi:hypothetical protein
MCIDMKLVGDTRLEDEGMHDSIAGVSDGGCGQEMPPVSDRVLQSGHKMWGVWALKAEGRGCQQVAEDRIT